VAARPRRNPAIVWRLEKGMHGLAWDRARKGEEYEEIGVLTLMLGESIHQLNLVGAEIWTRINGINTAEKIAAEIEALLPREQWIKFSTRLILHGRRVCSARSPGCDDCVLAEVCPKFGVDR